MRQIAFRLVPLFALVLSFLIPSAVPLAAQSANTSIFGINSHIASRYPEVVTLGTPANVVSQSGSGWVREDFQLSRIAVGPGRYDWGFHDQAINELRSRNIQVIGLLNGPTPSWMSGRSGTQFVAPDPQAFASFAAAVVERYKDRISHWEIWNEPENSTYWQPAANPAAYAQLLIQASAAIKRVDPNAKILSGGVVTPEPGVSFLTELSKHGAWNAFDIISAHAYVDPKTPEEGQIGTAGIGQIKALADRLGSKPIWVTEYGWSTAASNRTPTAFSPEEQANYLVRGAALMRAAGAERVLWYNLKDDSQHYGLIPVGSGNRDYGARKPAYSALQTLNNLVGTHQSVQTLELNSQQMLLDFESFGNWRVGDQKNGTLTQTSAQAHSGTYSAQLSYSFNTAGNDYVVFTNNEGPTIAAGASTLSLWVYGDGSGHALKVWIRDANGEVLQFRLGFIGAPGWQRLSIPITGSVPSYDRISGGGNLQLDLPARLTAFVLDDEPDHHSTSGTIYLDDLSAGVGGESYGVRFNQGNQVVDLLWSPSGSRATISSSSANGQLYDRSGGNRTINASNGQFALDLGPSPVYLVHSGGGAPAPAPAPAPVPPPANQRCFPETGFCIGGRIREYWEQNGGLPVFGYPTSEQHIAVVEGREVQAQWFERNRLELHPQNARPYDVLLGRLGAASLEKAGRDWQQFAKTSQQANCRYFAETGHNICGEFLQAWRANGLEFDGRSGKSEDENLALWGMPLSEAQTETTPDGKVLTVQWFERARFELHPDNQPPYRVLMGLLGNELRP